ncbi:MAG: UDP-4-amino-4,6-dideoxy-N-acetyl-beta-L-altrosamine transaminase [Cyclobacteriaceae bacterium]|nr:UDP-4-amino-4,6-dideoxy-N-acetyl-beta-L-altrosamine transaminase [Cyclobacteriaceae bacterium]
MNSFIPYGKQQITQEDVDAIAAVLKSDYITQGPVTKDFEEIFAKFIGSKYAIAVANGTAALHLSALALDVDDKQTVITTPLTFVASANCIQYCGGQIHFADIDPETLCIDLNSIEDLLKKNRKSNYTGVIPVDFAGYPVNTESLRSIADQYGLWILEDACHAPGGYFLDSNSSIQHCGNGTYADLSIFSFHPVKHITTGEGGMITSNDIDKIEKIRKLRIHGITREPHLLQENHGGWYYEMQELGYNYRITDFQCALGISQLKRADENLARRKKIAEKYTEAFAGFDFIKTPAIRNNVSHAWHLYVIQVPDRKGLYDYLRSQQIFTQVHYIPVHLQPYYKNLGWKKGDFPNAEKYYEQCLSIPMYAGLTDDEQSYTIRKILEFYNVA